MKSHVEYSAYVGLDVHKDTIADSGRQGEVRFYGNISNKPEVIRHLFDKLLTNYTELLVCYEAGPTGYNIYHQLTSMKITCFVVAPSRIPKSSSERIKNDHRDAMSLARLLRANELTEVWIPDQTHEAMRDLIRARSCAKKDSKIAKQRIQSMLLRCGRIYEKKSWTRRHRIWLANQSFPNEYQQIAFQHYCLSLHQIEDRISQIDKQIQLLLPTWSLFHLIQQLQALKGVGEIIAITVVAELGDFSRFTNPKQLMAYLGLVPGEHSSGSKIRSKGITKVGNIEVRKLLYEAAWSYRSNAKVGNWMLDHMPEKVCQESKDISWKAQQRLCRRYRSLVAKGKKSQVAITAVARELLGFMWDIAVTTRQIVL